MPKRTKQHCAELRVRHIDLIHPVKIFGSTADLNKCKAENQPKQRVKQQQTTNNHESQFRIEEHNASPFLAFPFLEPCVRHIDSA